MLFAGIDVGGTKVYAVIVNEVGHVLGRAKEKTGNAKGFERVSELMKRVYLAALGDAGAKEADIKCIGMAVPGAVDVEKRVVTKATNLGWANVDYAEALGRLFGKPFYVDNDVNMGAYGEYKLGAARELGAQKLYVLMVGTGVGGGFVEDGVVCHGKNFTAGEVGHTVIQLGGPRCACGMRGCLEALASKTGMTAYMKLLADGATELDLGCSTALDKLAPQWRTTIVGSKALRKAWAKGDLVVRKALRRSAQALGAAMGSLITTVGVDAFVLGGGVVEEMPDIMLEMIKQSMEEYTFGDGAKGVHVKVAELGDDAVAAGAALYARDKPQLLIQ